MLSNDLSWIILLHSLSIAAVLIWLYGDVIMSAMASQITSLTIVYSTFYSGADQREHQSSASLVFVRGIHRSLENVSIWWRHHGVWESSMVEQGYIVQRTFSILCSKIKRCDRLYGNWKYFYQWFTISLQMVYADLVCWWHELVLYW